MAKDSGHLYILTALEHFSLPPPSPFYPFIGDDISLWGNGSRVDLQEGTFARWYMSLLHSLPLLCSRALLHLVPILVSFLLHYQYFLLYSVYQSIVFAHSYFYTSFRYASCWWDIRDIPFALFQASVKKYAWVLKHAWILA